MCSEKALTWAPVWPMPLSICHTLVVHKLSRTTLWVQNLFLHLKTYTEHKHNTTYVSCIGYPKGPKYLAFVVVRDVLSPLPHSASKGLSKTLK